MRGDWRRFRLALIRGGNRRTYLEREEILAAPEYAATAAQERELAVVAPTA